MSHTLFVYQDTNGLVMMCYLKCIYMAASNYDTSTIWECIGIDSNEMIFTIS